MIFFSIDAANSKTLGRFVNDGEGPQANCTVRKLVVNGKPALALFAIRNIQVGEQLLYDYGSGKKSTMAK